MAIMIHRTTFALDEITIKRLKKLSTKWHLSQSEIIRRGVEDMEVKLEASYQDPLALLEEYHHQGGMEAHKANQYLLEAAEARSDYRGNE